MAENVIKIYIFILIRKKIYAKDHQMQSPNRKHMSICKYHQTFEVMK